MARNRFAAKKRRRVRRSRIRREHEYESDRRGREAVAADGYPVLVKGCVADRGLGPLRLFLGRRFPVRKTRNQKKTNKETFVRKMLVVKHKMNAKKKKKKKNAKH